LNNLMSYVKLENQENRILEVLSSLAAIVDRDGNILETNQRWAEYKKYDHPYFKTDFEGVNYFDLLKKAVEQGDDYALKMILGLREIIDGTRSRFYLSYPVELDGDKVWYKFSAVALCEEKSCFLLLHEDISDNIRVTKALKDSEEQYKQQFENAMIGITLSHTDGRVFDVNPAACKILGYTKQEITKGGRSLVFDMKDPENLEALKTRETFGYFEGDLNLIHKSGKFVPVNFMSKIYRNENGELLTINMFRDLSEKKSVEDKLDDEIRFTDAAIESIPGSFFVLDIDANVVRWNKTLLDEIEYTGEEIKGLQAMTFIDPVDLNNVLVTLKKAFEEGYAEVECGIMTKSGKRLDYYMRGSRFESEGKIYLVGTGINISAKIFAQKESKKQEALNTQLFSNSPMGIAMVDRENRVIQVNAGFENMFGYKKEKIVGKNIHNLITPAPLMKDAELLTERAFSGETIQEESIRSSREGIEIPVMISSVPITVDDEVIGIYGMYVDLSEQNQLHNQISDLLAKEKQARKEVEQSKLDLEEVFESAPSAIAITEGAGHRYKMANPAYMKLMGKENLVGHTIKDMLPELIDQGYQHILDHVFHSGELYSASEEPVMLFDAETDGLKEYFLNYVFKPLKNSDGEIHGIFIEAIDVTEQVVARKNLKASLEEKEILLQEVHHRVKNNLAVIAGLLDLQMMDEDNEVIINHLKEAQSRIYSIAKVHEAVYQEENVVRVQLDKYISMMANSVSEQLGYEDGSEVDCTLDAVALNLNQAVTCGLLVNELLNMSITEKAKTNGEKIKLHLSQHKDQIEFTMENSSIMEFKNGTGESFQFTLLQILMNQLEAVHEYRNHGENKLVIKFKKTNVKGSSSTLV
jgi:PAS domain S-box-containing protein